MNDIVDLLDTKKPGVTDLDIKLAEEHLDEISPNSIKISLNYLTMHRLMNGR